MPFALAELSGLATRGDRGTAGEQPPQPHLYGSDLGMLPAITPCLNFSNGWKADIRPGA